MALRSVFAVTYNWRGPKNYPVGAFFHCRNEVRVGRVTSSTLLGVEWQMCISLLKIGAIFYHFASARNDSFKRLERKFARRRIISFQLREKWTLEIHEKTLARIHVCSRSMILKTFPFSKETHKICQTLVRTIKCAWERPASHWKQFNFKNAICPEYTSEQPRSKHSPGGIFRAIERAADATASECRKRVRSRRSSRKEVTTLQQSN